MSPLDIKLIRDFRRLWAQGLAIALVAAAGVMTLVLGIGAYRALSETQAAYYERYRFAEVFATATRAPAQVADEIARIEGVVAVEPRIQNSAVLDIEGMAEPASGLVLTIPDLGEPRLNGLYYIEGGAPSPNRREIAVSGPFAEAHGFHPGDQLSAILGGEKMTLRIVGIALSPEFIYSVGGGGILPDNRRFGIVWMPYSDAAAAFDLVGAFNSISLELSRSAVEPEVIERLDDILKPFGGRGAYGRDDQISHAFLSSELTQLEAMSYVLPPIFLAVAAFLVNMTLARLITLEREQIGLLKALGYHSWSIAWHYMKLALVISMLGVVIGWGVGMWAGRGMAALYAEFYKFPFLFFQDRPDVFAISGLAALAAGAAGALMAVRSVLSLSAAVAMAPPAPLTYRRGLLDRMGLIGLLPHSLTMAARNMSRRPMRAVLTVVGITLSTGLLVGGLSTEDSVDFMIDASFFVAERQQASLSFTRPMGPGGIESVRRLPGVVAAEPFRAVPVSLSHGQIDRRSQLIGMPAHTDLNRVIDVDLKPVSIPRGGLVLSEAMAEALGVRVGETVQAEILDGRDRTLVLPVVQITRQFMGLGAYMEIGELNRALGEGALASGAHLAIDEARTDALYASVKATPAIAGMTLQRRSLETLRETIGENMGLSRAIYVTLAVIIVFGIVYNSMRIQLSERGRELASLRVLGFTRTEVSEIFLSELALLTLIAIPLGWVFGYAMATSIMEASASELFRFPLLIARTTYANASLVVLAATAISAYVVQRRVARLDLVAVLKTRE